MNNQIPQPIQRTSTSEYEFPAKAAEITILDRRGHIVWKQRRADGSAPIRWTGRDLYGTHVSIGSYTCKIVYCDNVQVVYLPFIFTHD